MNRSLALRPEDVHALLLAQLVLVLVAAAGFFLWRGGPEAQAALYGGGVALWSTWRLGRHVARASELAKTSPGRETVPLYIGAVERFVTLLILFALGMGMLGQAPLPLLVGFGAAQAGYMVKGALARARDNRQHLEKMG